MNSDFDTTTATDLPVEGDLAREPYDGQERSHRAVIALLALAAALLLVVGFGSSWYLHRIDERYSKLVEQSALDLDGIHDIVFHSGVTYAYASMASLMLAHDPQGRAALMRNVSEARAANDSVLEELERNTTDPAIRVCLAEVMARRASFRTQSNAFISASAAGGQLDLEGGARQLLRAFVDYQKSCDKLADAITARSVELSNHTARALDRLRLLLFGVGVLPVGLAVGLALLAVYLIRVTPMETDLH